MLRVAGSSDATQIADLVNRAYRPAAYAGGWTHESHLVSGSRTSAEKVHALMTPQSPVLVLCEEAAIRACVHVQAYGEYVHIGLLATDPLFQNQGLGKRMLAYAEQFSLEHCRVSMLRILVLSSRPELLAFYERRGYTQSGELQPYPTAAEEVGKPIIEGLQVTELMKYQVI